MFRFENISFMGGVLFLTKITKKVLFKKIFFSEKEEHVPPKLPPWNLFLRMMNN